MQPKEKRFHRWRIHMGAAFAMLFLMGKAYGARPQVVYQGVKFQKVSHGKAHLLVRFQLDNHTKKPLVVQYGRIDLRLDHHYIGYGIIGPVDFPKNRTVDFTVPVIIDLAELPVLLWSAVGTTHLPWEAKGQVEVDHDEKKILVHDTIQTSTLLKFG